MARPLNIYGHGREGSGGRKSVVRANRPNFFFGGASNSVPGPIDLAGVGAEVTGDDRESVILPMPVHEVAIERLRERGPERRMGSATVTRAERAVIERGIGLAGFAQDNDWRGKRRDGLSASGRGARRSTRTGWKAAGSGSLAQGTTLFRIGRQFGRERWRGGPSAVRRCRSRNGKPLKGGEVSAGGERSERATAAGRRYRAVSIGKRSATLGTEQRKRDNPRRCRGRPLLGDRERRQLVPGRSAREGGRSRRAADQAAAPKTMSGRLVQTAERSSPSAR